MDKIIEKFREQNKKMEMIKRRDRNKRCAICKKRLIDNGFSSIPMICKVCENNV